MSMSWLAIDAGEPLADARAARRSGAVAVGSVRLVAVGGHGDLLVTAGDGLAHGSGTGAADGPGRTLPRACRARGPARRRAIGSVTGSVGTLISPLLILSA